MTSLHNIITIDLLNGQRKPVIDGGRICLAFLQEERMIFRITSDRRWDIQQEDQSNAYLLSFDPHKLTASSGISAIEWARLFEALQTGMKLESDAADELSWVFSRIRRELSVREKFRDEFVREYVSLLFLHLKSLLNDEAMVVSMDRSGQLMKEFFELLEDRYRIGKTVEYYAEELCVSAKHLTNVIKTGSGHPTSYHINQRIVLEAKRRAQRPGACLKTIANDLGHEDVSSFSKLFKRVAGQTFSNYKEGLRMEYGKQTSIREVLPFTSRRDANSFV